MADYDVKHQAASLPTASLRGERYTTKHLEVIKECTDKGVPARILALSLHRSLYGIRSALRSVDARLAAPAVYRTHGDLPYDRGFTSLEEMGF